MTQETTNAIDRFSMIRNLRDHAKLDFYAIDILAGEQKESLALAAMRDNLEKAVIFLDEACDNALSLLRCTL